MVRRPRPMGASGRGGGGGAVRPGRVVARAAPTSGNSTTRPFHRSMVGWAADWIRDGHMPFDGWYPYLSLGASRSTTTIRCRHPHRNGLAGGRRRHLPLVALPLVGVLAGVGLRGRRSLGRARWRRPWRRHIDCCSSSASGPGYEPGSDVWRRGRARGRSLGHVGGSRRTGGLCWQAIAKGKSRLWRPLCGFFSLSAGSATAHPRCVVSGRRRRGRRDTLCRPAEPRW